MAALVNGMPIVVEEKHPAEVLRLQLDWGDYAGGSTISDSVWVDALPAAGLTLSGAQLDGFKTGTLVAAGLAGLTGYVENRVAWSDGRVAVMTFQIIISDRLPS